MRLMADGGPLIYRDATDSDSAGLMDLIRSVFSEYPGCIFDLTEMPELFRPATHFHQRAGRLWVAESCGRIVGSLGLTHAGDSVELHKVYVSRESRRTGIARRLLGLAFDHAKTTGAGLVELWTDTRFESGHRFYESCGFVRLPETRELHDLSDSVEYHYRLQM